MSTTWYAAFALLAVMCVLNSVFLIAAMRQIGVLHQRVRPIGHGQVGGPQVGARLPAPQFETVDGTRSLALEAPILVLAYVAPGCDVCDDLVPVLHAFDRSPGSNEVEVALMTSASPEEARSYASRHGVRMPFVRHDDLSKAFEIPGSPYLIAFQRRPTANSRY